MGLRASFAKSISTHDHVEIMQSIAEFDQGAATTGQREPGGVEDVNPADEEPE
jgi:hypothetical protein